MSERKKKITAIKWIVCFAIPIALSLVPVTDVFTSTIKYFLVVSIFAICLIATEVIPMFAISVALPASYIVFLKVDPKVALAPWTIEIPWLILGGFVVTIALQKTGLLKRIAYQLILLFGGRFNAILFGMMILGAIISLVIADVAAKAILMGALALGLCNALNLKFGGKAASALAMAAVASSLGPSYLFYTGSTGNLVPFGVLIGAGFEAPGWVEYLTHMFVPQLIFVLLSVLIIALFFKPDEEIQSKEYFKEELKKYGKITTGEKKIAIISIILVILIATSSIHGVSIGWLFVFASVCLMIPGISLVKAEDIKEVNFTFILFVVACLSIGIVSANLGVGGFIADMLYPLIEGSTTRSLTGIWLMGFVTNFALTPLAAYSAFALPVAEMATGLGINYMPAMYTLIQSLEHVVFPYEYAPILIIFGMGMASSGKFIKYLVLRSLLGFVCLLVIFMPWWKLIGIL